MPGKDVESRPKPLIWTLKGIFQDWGLDSGQIAGRGNTQQFLVWGLKMANLGIEWCVGLEDKAYYWGSFYLSIVQLDIEMISLI